MGPASGVHAAHRPAVPEPGMEPAPVPGRPGTGAPSLEPVPDLDEVRRRPWLALRRRSIPGTDRHGLAAGQVLVVMGICFGLWGLLSAHSLRKSADASPLGARRTAALAVLGPLDGLSHLVFLDRLASVFQRAAGHDPDRVSPGGGMLADGPQPSTGPSLGGSGKPGSPGAAGGGPRTGTPSGRGTGQGSPRGGGHQRPSAGRTGGGNTGRSEVPPLRVPTPAHPLRVLVVGDSFAEDIELGLARAFDSGTVRLIEKGEHSTGLSRPDYFNWPLELSTDTARYRPDVVVVMLGGNDPQAVQTPSGDAIARFGVGDKRWGQAYRARVDRFVREATAEGAHVAWVGLPVMQDPAFSHNIRALDDIYGEETAKYPGVLFLDTWGLFTDGNGHYSAYLPDAKGDLQLVRDGDGIHLTAAGNDRLANALLKAMERRWKLSPKALG